MKVHFLWVGLSLRGYDVTKKLDMARTWSTIRKGAKRLPDTTVETTQALPEKPSHKVWPFNVKQVSSAVELRVGNQKVPSLSPGVSRSIFSRKISILIASSVQLKICLSFECKR